MVTTGGVANLLRQRVIATPDDPLVKCGGDWISATELEQRASRLAAGLQGLGVAKGDRVALLMPNCEEMIESIFACAVAGAVQVPLNSWLKGEFLRHQLADCGARVLITDASGAVAAAPLLRETDIERLVVIGTPGVVSGALVVDYDELAATEASPRDVIVGDHDLFTILYTSGTTGLPKGCMLTHGYYLTTVKPFGETGMIRPGDRTLTAFPLFHVGGQALCLMGNLMHGGAVRFEAGFSATNFLAHAREDGVTMLMGVGAMAAALLAQPPDPRDTEHEMRVAFFAPMSAEQIEAFERRFGVYVMSEAYGQTECNPITFGSLELRRPGTTGRALPHLDLKIVDDDDVELAVGDVGEIVVRPRRPHESSLFVGYWRRPEATLEAWRNLWHHTGDYGKLDQDGFLTFVDRKKDAMRRRGENVSSHELEVAIARHPGVLQVAVCAVPSELGEDDIKACIVPAPGAELTPTALFDYFKDNLPYFAIPRYVELRSSLPMTATQRVTKQTLRDEGVPADCWDLQGMGLQVAKAERR